MKRLLIASVIVAMAALPGLAGQKCEISCNAIYQQADTELNKAWKNLSDIERNALRPAQRNWIKYRDNTCKKDDNCLTKITQQRTRYLQGVKLCTNNGGGLSCFEGK